MTVGWPQPANDIHIPRRASAVRDDGSRESPRPLADWRHLDAYVLLGDPGAGKSESMRAECTACGGVAISARDFITLGIDPHVSKPTVFIDGLDEMRAGGGDGDVPLDHIRKELKALGYPRFRLSCREYDWRVQTDAASLAQVAPGHSLQVLHLEPLSTEEQVMLLQSQPANVPDAEAFLSRARQLGLDGLFGNPLLLNLTVQAVVSQGHWPKSRLEVYELACRELATERSVAHRDKKPIQPGALDRLLHEAGLLCAVLLLSGKSSYSSQLSPNPASIAIEGLPENLGLVDSGTALASKIFTTVAGESTPLHRSIAEFLAARALTRLLGEGLPLGRLLALMRGPSGAVVEPLRGLLGWLAAHDATHRQQLLQLDPLAVVLNGDITPFSKHDKQALIQAIGDEALRNPWLGNRYWVSHPFAPLATRDMTDSLAEVLSDLSPKPAHQALVDCVLKALQGAEPIPALRPLLEAWVESPAAQFRNRLSALWAWKHCTGFDEQKALAWLQALHEGRIQDLDARLGGELLFDLYPKTLTPREVLRFWPKSGDIATNSLLPQFWSDGLIRQTRPEDFKTLCQAWLELQPQPIRKLHDGEWLRLISQILAKTLEYSGDQASNDKLHEWLGIGLDAHGFSRLDRSHGGNAVARWLSERPQRLKAVAALGWRLTQPDSASGPRHFWESESRLHGANKPRDWLFWLLEQAATAPHEELARYCFDQVAQAVVDPPQGLDVPSMERVQAWVEEHAAQWPKAGDWLLARWFSPLENNWQSDRYRRQRKHEAEQSAHRLARAEALLPHLRALVSGTAAPQLLHQLAGAYSKRFSDISGDTPVRRVQDFLVSDEATAQAAIEALQRVLERPDLPSADEVLALDKRGQYHLLRPAALLAAKLSFERNPQVVETWPAALLSALAACWLTDGTDETPGWYKQAVLSRPDVIAPVLVGQALLRLRRKGPVFVTGLWALSQEPGHAALARLALPALLEGFPLRASEPARSELNRTLLGALYLLDHDRARAIVSRKLDNPSLDPMQRICWLVADLPYRADAAQRLVDAVGESERRTAMLGMALHEQGSLDRSLKRAPSSLWARLIEKLAPITQPDRIEKVGWVGPAEQRRDTVHALIRLMATDTETAATAELQRLSELPQLLPWRDVLRQSHVAQQHVASEAHFVHAEPANVALTLANCSPANSADLMALTLDQLAEIEKQLRGSESFALRLFWDSKGDTARAPKAENECRDLLLERLKARLLPKGIQTSSERRAAQDKRADMRVDFILRGKPLGVPIEVKKEDNEGLWLAWRDQLKALYTNDPAANGCGIYLVLWFGHKPRSSPDGARADGPRILELQLRGCIPEEERSRLAVKVLDLSWPKPPGKSNRESSDSPVVTSTKH